MRIAATLLRRLEITLWIAGVCLLGAAAAATLDRWNHQAQLQRALETRGPASFAAPSADGSPAASMRAPARPEKQVFGPPREPLGPRLPIRATDATSTTSAPAADASRPQVESPARKIEIASRAKRSLVPSLGSAFGLIEIPDVGVSAVVELGADEKTLARAVGLVPESARPGQPGNIVLAGHRDSFFRPLRKIEMNDRIRLVIPPNTYEYEVRSLRVVEPSETGVLQSKGVEELTLVTCYPFRFIGPAPERFIVSATRVN